jgi:hypothetical protein
MLSGNKPAWIRQTPVEILIATDIDAARSLNSYAQGPAIRQSGFIFDSERQHQAASLRVNLQGRLPATTVSSSLAAVQAVSNLPCRRSAPVAIIRLGQPEARCYARLQAMRAVRK